MSDSNVKIIVELEPVDGGVEEKLQALNSQVSQITQTTTVYGKTMEQIKVPIGGVATEQDKANKRIQEGFSGFRIASRDLWTLAYAFRRLNTTVFQNNETVARFVNVMIALGSVLRILAIIQSVINNLSAMNGIIKALTAVWQFFNLQLAQSAFWMALITAGATVALGVAAWGISQMSVPKGYAFGGTVPATGTYYLHRGETVSTVNSPDYSQINVYVTTGPINSKDDVDRLFGQAAIKVARERRRRGA